MKKVWKRVVATALTVSLVSSFNINKITFAEVKSTNEIAIDSNNFPDSIFQDYVKSNFDENKDDKLSSEEISNITYIYVNMKGIKDLKGVENFTNLKYLYAEVNYIEELDLSQNKNLVVVYCNNNMINSIKLPNQEVNNTLEILNVFDNRLENINLENLKALKYLNLGYNKFKELDLSNNPLGDGPGFAASDNYLEKITLPNNGTEYEWLDFLAPQLYPKDKSEGYKVNWYFDEEKTQLIDQNTVKTIKCVGQTLYAEYAPITYTVQFNSNNGMAETKTQSFEYGTAKKLLKNEFTKKDYYFAGWKDEKGRVYNDESEVINLTDVDGKVLKLTAIWKEVDYTGQEYTINLHDGESIVTVKGKYGYSVELPKNESTKEGYDFMGWNFGTGNYGIFSDGGKVLMTHPDDLNGENNTLNLYSVWSKKEFTVNFIDTQNSYKKVVEYNEKVEVPEVPTKEGYNFEGWITGNGDKWDENSTIISNLNLYANYSPIKYSVSFDGNGADNEDAMNDINLEMDYSKQAVLPTNQYEKEGHILQGWSTSQNGEVEFNNEDVIYQLTTEENKNITLYAVWEKVMLESTVEITTESLNKVYDGIAVKEPKVEKTGSTKSVVFTWYEMINDEWQVIESAPSNAGKYKVVASVEADEDYKAASVEKEFEISKAIPKYEKIENLKATYGNTLNDVKLPEGFTWQEDLTTSVGNAGENKFKVTYTPKDTSNYEVVENIEVTINVEKATNTWTVEPSIEGWKVEEKAKSPLGKAKFGEVIFTYSNSKDGQFTNTLPNKAGTWYMKATVSGNNNYSGLEKIVSFVILEDEIQADNVQISNENNTTNKFTYGDKIIIKFTVNDKTRAVKKIALFANGVKVTDAQDAVVGKELTFIYDTKKGLINATGEISLKLSYVDGNVVGKDIYNSVITLEKKSSNSGDIKIPEINENVNLDNLQIKDGDTILKQGIDYDITKTQSGDTVKVVITFKGNYSGTITKSYKVQEIEEDTKPDEETEESTKPVPGTKPQVEINGGATRYETAVELSKSKFTTANTVVIAGGYALADGLTATPIATEYKAPLLLVEKNNIPEATKNEIKRLGAKNVIIVGGTGVITKEVENQLLSLGVSKITRLGGSDRYETSLLVAKYIDSNLYNIENIVVTNGLGEADALSIAPVSGRDRMPIILVRSNSIPASVKSWLKGQSLKNAYIIGGKAVVNDEVLKEVNAMTSNDISGNRLGGSTRYETNASIINKFYGNTTNKVYVSKGIELIDALSSGPIAALENSPVVLAGNDLTATQRSILSKRSTSIIVQAGHGISKNAIESLKEVLVLK